MKKTLLRILALSLSIIMLTAAFISCDNNDKNEDVSGDESESLTGNGSESLTDGETEAETEPSELVLFENGKTEYTLVRSDNASPSVVSVSKSLYDTLRTLASDGGINYYTDFVYAAAPITDREILVGKTEREESLAVYEELETLGENCYAVKVINQKIVIAGTTSTMLEMAVKYFVEAYLTESDGKITMSADVNYTYEYELNQPYQVIDLLGDSVVASAVKVGSLEKDGDFKVAQGGCTDGKYIYILLENQNTGGQGYQKESHYCKIFKIDVETMKTVKVSEQLPLDHGNDCTYNSDTNEIVVTHNAPNYKCISYVDADTLELKKTDKDNRYNMYAIAYSSTYKKYVVGLSGTYDYAVFAAGGTPIRYSGHNTGYTKQGMDCDDKYIYFIQYKENVITVHDWEGNYIRTVTLNNVSDEPEAIFFIGSQLYMTSYRGGSTGGANIYRIDLTSES